VSPPDKARSFDSAVLVTNRTDYFSNHHMLACLHDGLPEFGIRSELFIVEPDGSDLGPFMARLAAAGERTFLVDLNGKMRFESTKAFRKFSFVTDHPAVMLEYIKDTPAGCVMGYVDRSHLEFHAALGLPQKCVFFPHGGPQPEAHPLPMGSRDIGLLFLGRLQGPSRIGALRESLVGSAEVVIDLVAETAEAAADGAVLFSAFAEACGKRGIDPLDFDANGISSAITAASAFAESHNRLKVLTALKDQPVHVVGDVSEDFFGRTPENFVFHGKKSFGDSCALMGRSRLVLNSVTVFPQGSHERIWYAMAAGAVVVTDPSGFVGEDFTGGETILFWPGEEKAIGEMAADALADLARLDAMAAAAGPVYAANHTWKKRAAIVIDAVNGNGMD